MLEQVCAYIHNYFLAEDHEAEYTIAGGMISPVPPLKEGQRFWLTGSALNDGVYTFHAAGITNDDDDAPGELENEAFDGVIWAMEVPRKVRAGVLAAKEWKAANQAAMDSPYTSESVQGVYSYQKSAALVDEKNKLGLPPHISSIFERWRKTCL